MKKGIDAKQSAAKRCRLDVESTQADNLFISEKEWKAADNFFKPQKKIAKSEIPVKMKKGGAILHSFIRLDNNDLVALANKNIEGILGEGNFGVVVKGQKRDRSECAVKIEAGEKRNKNDKQVKIMKRINYHLGETHRILPRQRKFKGKWSNTRRYTVLALLKGKELAKQLEALTEEQRCIVAIKCCEALMEIHNQGIIHADVKPQNFIANIQGLNISVRLCDFDFALQLPKGKDCLETNFWCGTTEYRAPEISPKLEISTYSAASDIYALGIMFNKDLKLPQSIFGPMIHQQRLARCSLETTHERLRSQLANINLAKTLSTEEQMEPEVKRRRQFKRK